MIIDLFSIDILKSLSKLKGFNSNFHNFHNLHINMIDQIIQIKTQAHKLSHCMIRIGMQFTNMLLDFISAKNNRE